MEMYRTEVESLELDVDVSGVMRQVYMWMTGGLLITAFVAFIVAQTGLWTLALNPAVILITFVAQIGLVIFIAARINKIQPTAAGVLFAIYAASLGFTLSIILFAYTFSDITFAFVGTAAMFGAMSVIGFTTKMDLSKLGAILIMGLIGLIVVSILNIFLASDGLYWLISIAGVVIFTGLTAYDTQKIKRMAAQATVLSSGTGEVSIMQRRIAIIGALSLYLDFINLFLFLLRLIGGGRR